MDEPEEDATNVMQKPPVFSKETLKILWDGRKMHKYDAKQWGAYLFSSACSLMTTLCGSMFLWVKLVGWPAVWLTIKTSGLTVFKWVVAALAAASKLILHAVQ